jgi:hypothetical protein
LLAAQLVLGETPSSDVSFFIPDRPAPEQRCANLGA